MIDIPEAFAHETVTREGEPGRAWITALPDLADELLQRWSCTPDGPVMHGNVGVVLPVRHRDLPPAVIKISFPHPGNVFEPDAFVTWNGQGAVHLFERDDERYAMLLERTGRGTLADVTNFDEAVGVLGQLSHRLAVDAPAALPRLSDVVADWADEIRTTAAELGDPLPRHLLDAAAETLRELGPCQPETLVHGDLHDANVLVGEREPWLAIDPKGYVGDPAYDTITVIRSYRFAPLLFAPDPAAGIRRGLDLYCEAAGIDRDRGRRWAQVRAVKAALSGRHGDPEWVVQATDRLAEVLV
ncbi:aminoglycoside phosphotransferase family protein [Nocardia rhizosphaerihabitans]|uniref:aminoglycoside phosphotransferase family protein n=1 Tax=Nocardia rhizosphaerihabitans TaxID=1691570 RepID=UPI00366CCCFB